MDESQRQAHRDAYQEIGIGQDWADAIFNLRLAGWTADQVAALLRAGIEARRLGMTDKELWKKVLT